MGFFQISWLPSNKRGSAEEESLFSNLHARLPAGCSRLQAPGSLAPWHLGTLAPWHLGTLAPWLLRICQGARMAFFQISWLP
jgi:hypothetical protein